MSWFAIAFWSISIFLIAIGYYFQKKSGAKAVDQDYEQNLDQQIRRNSINSRPRKF